MNTRRVNLDLLNDPLFIGFDSMFNKLNQIHEMGGKPNGTNYPPYNIIKTGDDSYLIELAVAGFDEDDFDIELHDGILTIKADIGNPDEGINYLHKGIAARSFMRKFTLADTVEVLGVQLYSGMLQIRLQNFIPDEKKPKKFPVGRQLDPELLTE